MATATIRLLLLALCAALPALATDVVQFSSLTTVVTARESGETATALVIERSPAGGAITVGFALSAGGATDGIDFTRIPTGLSVSFAASAAQQIIVFTPEDDTLIEGMEKVTVTLQPGAGYTLGGRSVAEVRIADNDLTASASASDPSASEDYALAQPPIDRDFNRRGVVRIAFSAATAAFARTVVAEFGGTATRGGDYAVRHKWGGNALGAGRGFIVDNAGGYPADTKTLAVSSGGVGTLGFAAGDVVTFAGVSGSYEVTAGFTGTSGSITVRAFEGASGATGGLAGAVANGAALTSEFTTSFSGSLVVLNVPPTSTSIDFAISPGSDATPNDGLREGRETVTVTLYDDDNYAIISPTQAEVTIADVDVIADIEKLNDASEPTNNGRFRVTFSPAFPVGTTILVPYAVTPVAPGIATPGSDYTALPGFISVPGGATSAEIVVAPLAAGAGDDGNEDVILTLVPTPDYKLAGSSGSSAYPSATLTIIDLEGTVGIAASGAAATAAEAMGAVDTGTFTLTLTAAGTGNDAVTVAYQVSGTATNGGDYTTLIGSVAFPASLAASSTATITVTPLDDTLIEPGETVVVTLLDGPGYQIDGSGASATVTIADDEPVVGIAPATIAPHPAEPATAGHFTLSYPGVPAGIPLTRAVTVTIAYSGTASAADLTGSLPTLVAIPSGSLTTDITVTPADDLIAEVGETVIATIQANATAYTIAPAATSATVTIVDNEPVLTLAATATAAEPGTAGTFTITASPAPASPLALTYTVGGTATAGSDYSTLTGTVTVSAVTTSITVTPIDDSAVEGSETVTITITDAPTFGHAGTAPLSASVAIQDDESPVPPATGGKPTPGTVAGDGGGGCGVGSGIAAFALALIGLFCRLAFRRRS